MLPVESDPALPDHIVTLMLTAKSSFERVLGYVGRHARVAVAASIGLVGAPYLLLLKSPLRLAGDEMAYLSIAARMAGGSPHLPPPDGINYPRGYPGLIAGLDRIGLGVPWAFVGVNLIFLAIGIGASYVLLRAVFGFGRVGATLICCLLLLSRLFVWTAAVAVTDVPFFGLAMLCVLLLALSRRLPVAKAWLALGSAAVLAGISTQFRTIGLALLPPLLFACVRRPEIERILRRAGKKPLLAVGLASIMLAGLVGAAVLVIGGTGYASATKRGWHTNDGVGAVAGQAAHELQAELGSLGELALNVKRGRAPDALANLFPIVGVLVAGVVLVGVRARRRRLEVTEIFAGSIAITLLVWPGQDSRLWLPALPLLLAYGAIASGAYLPRLARATVVGACVLVFAAVGAFTLGRSVAVGLSGSQFPTVWAETARWTEPTYRVAFEPNASVDPRKVRRRVLLLLRRFEPRAKAANVGSTPDQSSHVPRQAQAERTSAGLGSNRRTIRAKHHGAGTPKPDLARHGR
ncbi:MAG: hypothetical protein ACXWZT_02495 [Gaiellaceae bacterium]